MIKKTMGNFQAPRAIKRTSSPAVGIGRAAITGAQQMVRVTPSLLNAIKKSATGVVPSAFKKFKF